MAKKANRMVLSLACTVCKERNYTTEKNSKNDSGRISMNKYCKHCRKHTEHREEK